MSPQSLEITAAIIVAARHRDEWRDVFESLERGETFLEPQSLASEDARGQRVS
jgi:hypothetical protein